METNKELITDAQIEQAALKHVAPLFSKIGAGGDYKQTEQFSRLKAFTAELFDLSQRSEATEAQRKAELWDFFNTRLLSRSGIVLNDKKDCQAAVDQWAEAHETHCTYKEKLRHAEEVALRGVTIHSTTIPTPAPSAAAGEQVPEIKRYEMAVRYGKYACEDVADPVEEDDGDWVRYSDVCAALAAQPTPAQGDAVPVAANDYSDMSREALERHATRMAQALANDKARKFHDKYATGPMMPPSCLCCGQLPDKVAIRHAELPGIVICEKCATRQSSADAVDAARYRLIRCYKIYGSWPSDAAKNSAVLAFSTCTKHELDEMLDELLGLKLPSNLHQLRSDYVEWRKKSTAQAIDAAIAKREGV